MNGLSCERRLLAFVLSLLLGAGLSGCGGGGESSQTVPVSPSAVATATPTPVPPPDGEAVIGVAGGTVSVAHGTIAGARVVVPPGALASDVTIRISEGTTVVLTGFDAAGPSVRLEPAGTTFAVAVTVTIPFTGVPPGASPVVLHRNDATGLVTQLTPINVDPASRTITCSLSSFSTVQAEVPSLPSPRLFIGDAGNGRVVRVDDMLGSGFTSFGGIPGSSYVAVDSSGRIYIAGAGAVHRMDDMQGTNLITFAPSGPLPQDTISPTGIAVDAQNRIYVTDMQVGSRIVRIDDMQGTNWTTFTIPPVGPGPVQPRGICLDAQGRIYFTEAFRSSQARVVRIDDMTGTNLVSFGRNNMGDGPFDFPMNVFVSAQHIYVSDSTRLARMDDMLGSNLVMYEGVSPLGLYIDSAERIYFTDRLANSLNRMDDMSGANRIVFGATGTGIDQFNSPLGLAGQE